jgi:putative SOS response-associated peptidase YedK
VAGGVLSPAKPTPENLRGASAPLSSSALLRPAAEDVLRLWPISRAVNNVRSNGAELLAPIDIASQA